MYKKNAKSTKEKEFQKGKPRIYPTPRKESLPSEFNSINESDYPTGSLVYRKKA